MKINGYDVIKTLGSGSFGTTYLVEKSSNYFALKLIRENLLALSKEDAHRIEREVKILSSINSTGVAKYVDDGTFQADREKYRYIVMEYINGESLEDFLKRTGSLSIHTTAAITKNIFKAVNDIHKQGVLHRDLKPSNIILCDEEKLNIKILDFGISKLIDASTLTTTGQGMGTYAYMAPEQLKSAKDIDHRADFYSIAAMMYEFLSNEKPLKMSNQLEALYKIMNEIPDPIINKVSNVPIEISKILEILMLKEPYKRNLTFEEIISLLNNCIKKKKAKTIDFNFKPDTLEFLPLPQANDSKYIDELASQHQFDGAIFNAPQILRSDKNYLKLQKSNGRLVIDPYTQTLGYSAFTAKKTYKELPYILSSLKKETPKDFIVTHSIEERAKKCLDFQINYTPDVFISPFHFYESEDSQWIKVDYNVYKEAKSYLQSLNINRPVYYGISLDIEKFEDIDVIEELINFISSSQPHGYYLQIAGSFDTLNNNHYYAYAYLVKLLSYSKKEIIVSRTNDFSLGLMALGANSIATSLGQGDSFKEEYLNRLDKGGGPTRRYYIKDLMGLYNQNILGDILSTKIGKELICKCDYCEGSIDTDKLLNFTNCIKHHYVIKKKQIEQYSMLSNQERIVKFSTSTNLAKRYIKEIQKEKKIKNLTNKHFDVWNNIILEVSKTSTQKIYEV